MTRRLILHVENDPNDVFLVQRAFREVSVSAAIQVVEDGARAVDYLKGKGEFGDRRAYPLPSLIFLDLSMPRMTGTEFLEWLRQQPVLKRIPVIILSSSKHARDVEKAYDLGANSYLVKPVCYNDLVEQIRAFKQYWLGESELPDMRSVLAS